MSSLCNVNTGTGKTDPGQLLESSSSNSNAPATRPILPFERHHLGRNTTLRLPRIQLPPDFEIHRHRKNPPLRTCPSLHQHNQRRPDAPSTESLLRKFFAKQDNTTELIIQISSHGGTASSSEIPSGKVFPNDTVPQGRQEPQLGTSLHQFSSSSHLSYQPNVPDYREQEQTALALRKETLVFNPPSTLGSNSPHAQEDDKLWESSRQPASSSPHLERSAIPCAIERGTQREIYRCSDCNRKCKSKASYMKHRSMMCTHRLGPLTLECRYCQRHYTYAGYLQRHEYECAKTKIPL